VNKGENKMNLEHTARAYFSAFENKKLDTLFDMFHENVSLKDWNLSAQGRRSVLVANAEIFDAIDKISVNVENLYLCDMTVVAELSILADDQDPLPVVDIIKFHPECIDGHFKIESIVAYRGN